jgi:nicotinamide N-methyltransferase
VLSDNAAADSAADEKGFDMAILSDLLHFNDSHDTLIRSLSLLLSRRPDSRAYIAAGKYTPEHHCDEFVRKAAQRGIVLEECEYLSSAAEGEWLGALTVSTLDRDQLSVRKAMCRMWVGRWEL